MPLWIIPLYLLGVGLIVAALIVGGGISDLLEGDAITLSFDSADNAAPYAWLETLFTHISHPLATILFSLGMGGLAIINIFVAEKLLHSLDKNLPKHINAIQVGKSLRKHYTDALHFEEQHESLSQDIADLTLNREEAVIAETTSLKVLSVINDALTPHELHIKDAQLTPKAGLFDIDEPAKNIDLKQLEKMITRIKSIDANTIISAMTLTEKK